jgi:hypothetical protein
MPGTAPASRPPSPTNGITNISAFGTVSHGVGSTAGQQNRKPGDIYAFLLWQMA